jgi:sigma-B regulation protein RsbU (phosphoserine phosphatase)
MMIDLLPRREKAMPSPWPYNVSTAVRSSDGGDRCGDLIVYQALEDGTVAVVVVDGAGRGKALRPLAYYVATNLLGLLVMQCPLERAASIADRDFRAEFRADAPEFVTVFAGLLDPDEEHLRYLSAGHETALIARPDRSHVHLGTTGPAFGIASKPRHYVASVPLRPGDNLIVVTDGITDARDAAGSIFGSRGVLRSALRSKAAGTDGARALLDDAARHAAFPADDRAAIVLNVDTAPSHILPKRFTSVT